MTLKRMNENETTARVQLLIRKVWVSGFSWSQLENYFSLNRNTLMEEVKNALSNTQDFAGKFQTFCDKVASNEKVIECFR